MSNVKDDDVVVAPLSSVARTVIACDCGDSVAVPEITPAEESVKPLGNVPDCTAYVYGLTPPDAESVSEYAVPTVAVRPAVGAARVGAALTPNVTSCVTA
ncbi:unannotated protein [freshwater metagenome]|uniref:Unannotated protein n=1 Tax=freshwater metagenome TaxID=449393 RepID=A0A6J6MKA4_9ZZZZ